MLLRGTKARVSVKTDKVNLFLTFILLLKRKSFKKIKKSNCIQTKKIKRFSRVTDSLYAIRKKKTATREATDVTQVRPRV